MNPHFLALETGIDGKGELDAADGSTQGCIGLGFVNMREGEHQGVMSTYFLLALSTIKDNDTTKNSAFSPIPSHIRNAPWILIVILVEPVGKRSLGRDIWTT